jgi:dTDP-D-glucose 4,6-dehydratase
MRRLLVTGGAGFIGANFCHYWSERHSADRVVVLDALTYAGNPQSIASLTEAGKVRFVRGDIAEGAQVASLIAEEHIDTIVNFAAESHVDRSIENAAIFLRTNVLGTQALLEAARDSWGLGAAERGCRFHHVSTDEVYGSLMRAKRRSPRPRPTPRAPPTRRARRRRIIWCAPTGAPTGSPTRSATARTTTGPTSFRRSYCRCAC